MCGEDRPLCGTGAITTGATRLPRGDDRGKISTLLPPFFSLSARCFFPSFNVATMRQKILKRQADAPEQMDETSSQ